MQCLNQKFGDCLIMWYAPFLWPPQSPDLTSYDFFLLEHLKANVFSTPVLDLSVLKNQIQIEIGKIWKEMLQKVYENALVRFHIYIVNDGHHLHNVVLK